MMRQQQVFRKNRLEAQKKAERLGLGWYIANGQKVTLLGALSNGAWPKGMARHAVKATPEDVKTWDEQTKELT